MFKIGLKLFCFLSFTLLSGCAVLHHVQIGQIDNRSAFAQVPFDIKVSETGISTEDAGNIAKSMNSRSGDDAAGLMQIIAIFQMGARTGNPIYDVHYAEKLIYQIHEKCPSGKVTGLMSIRETRKYPVISGEIIKITGYCLRARTTAQNGDL